MAAHPIVGRMPIKPCTRKGKSGHRWGNHGRCYVGKGSRDRADAQAAAAHAHGYEGHAEVYAELSKFCQEGDNKGKPGPCPTLGGTATPPKPADKPSKPMPKPKGSDGAATPATQAHAQVAASVQQMQKTPQGKAQLARGQKLAASVKHGIASGIDKAIGAVDADSLGALSGLIGSLKQKDSAGAYHAANALFRSVFTNVHQEVFENALSLASGMPASHALGKIAAKGAAAAETGLLKAIAWSWGQATGKHSERFDEASLTDGDKKLIAAMTRVAEGALRNIYQRAGLGTARIDTAALEKRIAASLLAAAGAKPVAAKFSEEPSTLDGVEIFAAGEHRGKVYTRQDLDDMVRNFQEFCTGQKPGFRVPLVIGHEENQEWLARSDLPAAGWCSRVWRDGDKLLTDFEDVPPKVVRLLLAKTYRTVSSEVYDAGMPKELAHQGKMLRRVALLGADIPQVKDLEDVPTPTAHAETRAFAPWRRITLSLRDIKASATPGAYWCFSEARTAPMTLADFLKALKTGRKRRLNKFAEGQTPGRDEMIAHLGEAGLDTSKLDGVPDEALAEMCRALDSDDFDDDPEPEPQPDAYDEADSADGLAPHALDNLPVAKNAEEKRTFAEHARKYAARARRFAERAKKYMEAYCDMHADDPKPEPAPKPKDPEPAVDKHAERRELVNLIRNEIRTAIDGNVKTSIAKLEKFREMQESAQQQNAVEAFCESQLKAGRLTAAEYKSKAAGGPDGSVYRRLMRASASKVVHKFSEGTKTVEVTDLQDQMREIEDRPTLFGERYRDPKPQPGTNADGEQIVLAHFDKFSEDYNRAGYKRDKFLDEYKALNDANKALMLEEYRKSLQS